MKLIATTAALIAVTVLSGCGANSSTAAGKDQAQTNNQLDRYQANQPVPAFDRSQLRQQVITVENAQAHGVATTTFFFNQGVQEPIFVCPSIGFPIPSTAQLTNPQQALWGTNSSVTIGQMEPTGVYTGDSTGTYVECVAPSGTQFIKYWEGFVDTIGGPAHWDGHHEVLDGEPTVVTKK
ncbi:hypothetical protein [Mycolicibacterium sphagni]|uniref:hypothetical protein n=1 Tax=Mycolicibacterium sphagni TaxID=1786 RepID=UPI0021F2A024|nr:hypothetical protein [Mycolicibacterium sphagni]MCV7174920.1 hypothetical protein [Mycolicibacterium sphagni]